ncbi:unnamed protein product [marine sediment metagenome]|uniref:Uncharacterized protein n=1 Tax=marine sediment metagenome TaxID=412755 RepID=X1VND7_9ZZZZ
MILTGNLFWAIYTVFSKPFLKKIWKNATALMSRAAGRESAANASRITGA